MDLSVTSNLYLALSPFDLSNYLCLGVWKKAFVKTNNFCVRRRLIVIRPFPEEFLFMLFVKQTNSKKSLFSLL